MHSSSPIQRGIVRGLAALAAALVTVNSVLAGPPAFAPIPNLTVSEDAGLTEIPFQFDPGDRSMASLSFSATANNPKLIAADGLRAVGAGTNRILECITLPDAFGTATIALVGRFKNLDLAFTNEFQLTVLPVEDPPQIEPIDNIVIIDGMPPRRVPLRISAPDGPAEILVQVTPRTQFLTAQVGLEGTNRFLLLASSPSQRPPTSSRGTIQVTARNRAGADSQTFYVNVEPPDFVPARRLGEFTFWPALQLITDAGIRWADVNRDGFLDVVSFGTGTVNLNPGRPISQSGGIVEFPQRGTLKDVLSADLNGDGTLDFFFYGVQTQGLYRGLTLGPNSTRFEPITNTLEVLSVAGAAFADLDGNGTVDLIYDGTSQLSRERRVVIALNDGQGELTMIAHNLPPRLGPLVATDFNGDGKVDLLLAQTNRNVATAQIFVNRGRGDYLPGATVGGTDPVTAAGTADFDGDGVPDVWLVHQLGSNPQTLALDLYRQDGGQFTRIFGLSTNEFHGLAAPAFGDFDNDGRVDFVASYIDPAFPRSLTTTTTNFFTWYRNEDGGQFNPQGFLFMNTSPLQQTAPTFSPAIADADGDGDLDLLGTVNPYQLLFLNQQPRANLPPAAPTDLRSLVLGDELFLFWTPATDGNQTSPLTYNVRIGSRSGGQDIMPAHSTTNGVRMLSAPGNTGFQHYCVIRLPRTDLDAVYWSVQAVDASYAGGIFAPEQSLTISLPGNEPPVVELPKILTIAEDSSGVARIHVTDDRTPIASLNWRAEADDRELIPTANVFLRFDTQPPTNPWTLVVRPAANAFGTTTIRVIATDRNGASSTNSIEVNVTPINDPPSLVLEASHRALRGQPAVIRFTASDLETPWNRLTYRFESSDPELLPVDHIEFQGTGANRELIATPAQDHSGPVDLRITLFDEEGATSEQSITVNWQDQVLTSISLPYGVRQLRSGQGVDFDGDGALDIVGITTSGEVEVWRQEPRGIFSRTSALAIGPTNAALILRDFDRDGDLDVVVWSTSGAADPQGTIRLLTQENGQLVSSRPLRTEDALPHLLAFDADGDGALDLLAGGQTMDSFRIGHPSTDSPSWEPPGLDDPDNWLVTVTRDLVGSVEAVDWNDDGRMDVVFSLQRESTWRYGLIWEQEPGGRFLVRVAPWRPFTRLKGWTDFNNDGLPDVLLQVPGNGSPRGEVPLWQRADGTFDERAALPLTGSIVTGDLDGDGRADVLGWQISSDAYGYAALSAVGSTSPRLIPQDLARSDLDSARPGDFDGDGNLDLLVPGLATGLSLVMNANLATNHAPSAPTELLVRSMPGGVEFSWAAAKDPEQSAGLTYNVQVGTAPGLSDVVSAEARADGRGLVVGPGNAGWRRRFSVVGLLPDQTYFVRVQAVDSGYLRSPFSDQMSFRVTAPPVVSTIPDQILAPGAGPLDLEFTVSDPETPSNELVVRVSSSNAVLLSSSRLHVTGSGSQRTVHLEPKPDRAGSAIVSVVVTDASGLASVQTFSVSVPSPNGYAVEYPPSFVIPMGQELELSLDAFDPDHDFGTYRIETPFAHGVTQGTAPHLVYQPAPGFWGVDRLVGRASAPGSLDASVVVTITVEPPHHLRPELRVVEFLGERRQLLLRARAATRVHLEHSRNLMTWESAGDYVLPANESLLMDAPGLDPVTPHFYRAQQPD